MIDDLPGAAADVPDHEGGPHAAYEALLAADVLAFQACTSCRSAVFPPRGRCPHCGAGDVVWRASAGRGVVYSTTVLSPREQPAYAVVLVDLDEGFRMMSRMTGEDASSVAIEDRVVASFDDVSGVRLPLFAREGGVR